MPANVPMSVSQMFRGQEPALVASRFVEQTIDLGEDLARLRCDVGIERVGHLAEI